MSERIHCFEIPKDVWYAAISALRDEGWRVETGGGLDHSWAVLERDGMRIEMEYDIWMEGEMVVAAADVAKLKACFPAPLLAKLGLF
ncbi:hypothetical protein [Sinorhizobium sp. RAC02]|uniref:hypothetical protein n=1 Tax=Sinorhizobium sp. RAC02 TaxID=1842534 RepID=UPI00123708D6|nr:hypothetical protein [Sinorhizobium sp. RAC02]